MSCSDTAAAWAAGFLEADGSFSLIISENGKGARHAQPKIQASQMKPEPILRLQELYGGYVGVCDHHRPPHDRTWMWRLSSHDDITRCLTAILPHMVMKKIQAGLLLEALEEMPGRGGRYTPELWAELEDIRSSIIALNALRYPCAA